jgi:glutathione synthase
MLDLLFVMDPLASVNPHHDTTYDLMAAAEARGHRVYWCHPHALGMRDGKVTALAEQVSLRRDALPHHVVLGAKELVLRDISATFMRKDPPVDAAFMNATLLLWAAFNQGARVFNRPDSLLSANEKLYALRFPEWVPETRITSSLAEVKNFLKTHEHIVLKPLDGNGGRGVFLARRGDSNLGPIVEALSFNGKVHMLIQRYLPEVKAGDKRIVLVDGEPLGVLNRVPQGDDHRANLHAGGKAVASELSERERQMCAALKPALLRDGLFFVGIDVIGGYLTEVNVTSPTGIQEIRALGGPDIAPEVIAHLERKCA